MSYQPFENRRHVSLTGTQAKVAHQLSAARTSTQQPDIVALEFVFDFAPDDQLLYVSAENWPPRHFLLSFWRHAKDGMMFLLGLERSGPWRDPTHCKPNSYTDWVPRNRFERNEPGVTPPARHSAATAGAPASSPSAPYDDLCTDLIASREVMVEIEPGMYELPKTVSPRNIPLVQVRPKQALSRAGNATKKKIPLGIPLDKQVVFQVASARFLNTDLVDKELAGIVKLMKQFPEVKVTFYGNVDGPTTLDASVLGRGRTAIAYQNAPRIVGRDESGRTYNSIGELMDARAEAIKQHLLKKGIKATRITCKRGQLFRQSAVRRSVTVLFSK